MPRNAPPFFIQNGTNDPLISVGIVTDFYEALKTVLSESDLVLSILEGAGYAGGGTEYFEEKNIMAAKAVSCGVFAGLFNSMLQYCPIVV